VIFVILTIISFFAPKVFKYLIFVPVIGVFLGSFFWVWLSMFIPELRSFPVYGTFIAVGIILSIPIFERLTS
jgi:hypothetical protein